MPKETDIMIIFDTSGSMEGVLDEAKEEVKTLIAKTEESLPSVEFGVANVEDISGTSANRLRLFWKKKNMKKTSKNRGAWSNR